MRVLFLVISLLLVLLSCNNPVDDGPEIDWMTDIDGNVNKTVKIGDQWWMKANLKVTKYNDGSAISLVSDSAGWCSDTLGAFCYYDNTTDKSSIIRYGALYNRYAVDTKKLAPTGWHVPDSADWAILQNFLITNGYNWDGTTDSNKVAKSMAGSFFWKPSGSEGDIGYDLDLNNSSGFTAYPGGYRGHDGVFRFLGNWGYWWSSKDIVLSNAFHFGLCHNNDYLFRFISSSKNIGFSVRCVKD